MAITEVKKKIVAGSWICSSCRFTSTNNCSLVRHSQILHQTEEINEEERVKLSFVWIEGLKCHLCSFFATSQSLLDDHLLNHGCDTERLVKYSLNLSRPVRSRKKENDDVLETLIFQSDVKRRLFFEENNNESQVKKASLKKVVCSLCKLFDSKDVNRVNDKNLKTKKATIIRLRKTMAPSLEGDSNPLKDKDNKIDLRQFNCTKCRIRAENCEHPTLKVNLDISNSIKRNDLKCSNFLVEEENEKERAFEEFKEATTTMALKVKEISIVLNGAQCRKCGSFATSHSLLEIHQCIQNELTKTHHIESKPESKIKQERIVTTGNASKPQNETFEETKLNSVNYSNRFFKAKKFCILLTRLRY